MLRLSLLVTRPIFMSKTTNRLSPAVRARAVRLVLDHAKDHSSRWAAVSSIAANIGCTAQALNEWVKKAEVDSGMRAGLRSEEHTSELQSLMRISYAGFSMKKTTNVNTIDRT